MKAQHSTLKRFLKTVSFRRLTRFGFLLLFAGLMLGGCKSEENIPEPKEGLKIVYIRHAEGGHNVKRELGDL